MSGVFSTVCATLGTCAVIGIMLSTVADVIGRFLFRASVPGAVETAELLLVAAAFLGLGVAQQQRAHVSIAILLHRLPARAERVFRRIDDIILLLFFGWACTTSTEAAWIAFTTGDYLFGLINLPTWPARAAMAVGFLAIFLQVLTDLMSRRPQSAPEPRA
jgi:TRAP-type C4-dicarboxylate transport system permease small subunit